MVMAGPSLTEVEGCFLHAEESNANEEFRIEQLPIFHRISQVRLTKNSSPFCLECSMPDEIRTPESATPPQQPPTQTQFTADASAVTTVYTNACRCNFTPEEIILDF